MSAKILLAVLGIALLFGVWALGVWWGRRGRKWHDSAVDPALLERLDALERARAATERANAELQKAMVELEMAAGTDRLTGAWNRRRFEEGAAAMMALANRKRDPLPLLLFDLDHFKRINDTYGHDIGDQVLVQVVQTVRSELRASDALTRWGGEEFLILAPGTYLSGATALGEKVRAAVAATLFPEVGQVTISVGVAEYRPGEPLLEWVRRVDQALYRAKDEGRNRVVTLGDPVVPLPSAKGSLPLLELRWDRSLESGHALIDAQHRELFDMINALLASIAIFPDSTEVGLRLQVFQAHVVQHFHDEEAVLAQIGYPRLAVHAERHRQINEQANTLRKDLREGRLELSQVLGFLAVEVVRDHLVLEDRDFFPCLKSSALR